MNMDTVEELVFLFGGIKLLSHWHDFHGLLEVLTVASTAFLSRNNCVYSEEKVHFFLSMTEHNFRTEVS